MKRTKPDYAKVDRIKPDYTTVDRKPLTEEQKEKLKQKEEKKKKDKKIIKWLLGLNFIAIIIVIIDVIRHGKREFTDKDQVEEWLLELYPDDDIEGYMENKYDSNKSLEEYAIAIENSVSLDDVDNFL